MAGRPGRSGKHRKPTSLKIIQGTFRRDRAPKKEPKPPPIRRRPAPPRQLPAEGKKLWKRLVPGLIEQDLLTALDLPCLELCCLTYGLYRELWSAIKRKRHSIAAYMKGKNSQTAMEYTGMKSALMMFRIFALEFGLSPASRARIDLAERDPFAGLAGKKGDEEQEAMKRLLDGR